MDNLYSKFISKVAYKYTLDKPNTNYNLAWYEELGRHNHRVAIDSIWVDSVHIPIKAPQVDANGFFVKEVEGIKLKILQKCTKIKLDKVVGMQSTYSSPFLKDAIIPSFGEGYEAELTDCNGEVIPFGLNQWIIDPDSGQLSFMRGWPNGFQETPILTFFRYAGRKADSAIILSSGQTLMAPEYEPTRNKDVATKGYVDKEVNSLGGAIKKLIPKIPPTLENVELALEANYVTASPWNSEVKMPVVFYGDEYKIKIPQFYHPGECTFSIVLNNVEILTSSMENITGPDIKAKMWYIESVVDPYSKSKMANNFYKSINSYIVFSNDILKTYTSTDVPYITVYVKQRYGFKDYISKPITIGFEDRLKLPAINQLKLRELKSDNGKDLVEYISGVPTLSANSNFIFNYTTQDINLFKVKHLSSIKFNDFYSKDINSNSYYSQAFPFHKVEEKVVFPENLYIEKTELSVKSSNIEGIQNVGIDRTYNIRVDTVSKENRIPSPINFSDYFNVAEWDINKKRQDLHESNELQMLNGLYRWPTGNYKDNGNFSEHKYIDEIDMIIPKGPDYTDIEEDLRFATFVFDIDLCRGFWLTFNNDTNIISDVNSKAFNLPILKCRVIGSTEWLDMLKPYEGVLNPRDFDDGCLVTHLSNLKEKYFTFGNEPLEGKLVITIGIKKANNITFSGISINQNH